MEESSNPFKIQVPPGNVSEGRPHLFAVQMTVGEFRAEIIHKLIQHQILILHIVRDHLVCWTARLGRAGLRYH